MPCVLILFSLKRKSLGLEEQQNRIGLRMTMQATQREPEMHVSQQQPQRTVGSKLPSCEPLVLLTVDNFQSQDNACLRSLQAWLQWAYPVAAPKIDEQQESSVEKASSSKDHGGMGRRLWNTVGSLVDTAVRHFEAPHEQNLSNGDTVCRLVDDRKWLLDAHDMHTGPCTCQMPCFHRLRIREQACLTSRLYDGPFVLDNHQALIESARQQHSMQWRQRLNRALRRWSSALTHLLQKPLSAASLLHLGVDASVLLFFGIDLQRELIDPQRWRHAHGLFRTLNLNWTALRAMGWNIQSWDRRTLPLVVLHQEINFDAQRLLESPIAWKPTLESMNFNEEELCVMGFNAALLRFLGARDSDLYKMCRTSNDRSRWLRRMQLSDHYFDK